MFTITHLQVAIGDKRIVENVSFSMIPGSVTVLMGPNGSGKSTLAHALIGHPECTITHGNIWLHGQDLGSLSVDKRAQEGVFLSFQHPYEIPGLTVFDFLRESYQAIYKKVIGAKEFKALAQDLLTTLGMSTDILERHVNVGFSGGEKKRLELLHLLLLNPKIAILDEIDSGLDVDALGAVAKGIQELKKRNPDIILLIITHYPRLLTYLHADTVHVMSKGTLIRSGGQELAFAIEQRGYDGTF